MNPSLIMLIGMIYILLLFGIAYFGDQSDWRPKSAAKALIYSLSISVYCTSWTVFASVGSAVNSGWVFFSIYLGPILVFVFGHRLLKRVIRLTKHHKITSIGDFMSARYGKSPMVAAVVSIIALVGIIPYIALQLQAVNLSFSAFVTYDAPLSASSHQGATFSSVNNALLITIVLAIFSILFGTRHLDKTEHHRGMIYAIAFESIVKLIAMLLLGGFAIYLLWSTPAAMTSPGNLNHNFYTTTASTPLLWSEFLIRMLLAIFMIFLLPRQFQVIAVEAESHDQINSARWLFPLYLILISLVAIPIAMAGTRLLSGNDNPDLYVLLLPLAFEQDWLALLTLIGGLSAATGMVIVSTITLSTMISNDLVIPLWFRYFQALGNENISAKRLILSIRQISIIIILIAAYGFLLIMGSLPSLASVGLLSFAAIAQIAPSFFAGLFWEKCNRGGAILGMIVGFLAWLYFLILPTLYEQTQFAIPYLSSWVSFRISMTDSISPYGLGVLLSLGANIVALFIGTAVYRPNNTDLIQASIFRSSRAASSLRNQTEKVQQTGIKEARSLAETILGEAPTAELFAKLHRENAVPADDNAPINHTVIEEIERSIAAVIGASSARHIIVTQLLSKTTSAKDLFAIMDQTTQALQFNQELLQASFDNINQGISVVDEDLRLIAWNAQYLKLFSIPANFLTVGMPIDTVYQRTLHLTEHDQGDHAAVIKRRLRGLRSNKSYSAESALRDGRHIKSTGNPLPGGGYITSFTDITEQKNNELQLKKREEQIRLYTDNLPLMLCYVDRDLRFQFANKAYCQFVQQDPSDIEGKLLPAVLQASNFGEREDFINSALSGARIQFHSKVVEEDGATTHYQINYIPDYYPDQSVAGYFSIYQDITDLVEVTEELNSTNTELESRVTLRTQELEQLNQQLQQEVENTLALSKEVEAMTRSKTRFLAAASHDLLQPINAARLFTNTLIEQIPDKVDQPTPDIATDNPANSAVAKTMQDRQTLQKIDSALTSADRLLRALLDISKLDTGRLEADISAFPISKVLTEIENELKPLALQKGLAFDIVPCKKMIESDAALLRSILQNLVANAIRYTHTGRLLVGCRRQGNKLSIQVWDTGVGIDEANLETIFIEFHQLQNDTQDADKGLGLGLAIASRLSQQLDHPLTVRSAPNRGSVFAVSVPLHDGDYYEPTMVTEPTKESVDFSGLNIICLENTANVLEALAELLRLWGCTVHTALSTEQAKRIAEVHPFNVVIADYRLDEDATGIDFFAYLDHAEHIFNAILVTAEQDDKLKIICRDYGYHFLAKPVDPVALKALLKRLDTLPSIQNFTNP